MFTKPKIIRCKKCKRVFSDYADNCPECHAKTPRGWIGIAIPIICVVLAIAVLALTIYFLTSRPPEEM